MSQPHIQSPHKAAFRRYYVHLEGLALLSADTAAKLAAAEALAPVVRVERYTVVRFEDSSARISLLHYPRFFEEGFPALRESWHVDLTTRRVSYRTYEDSLTPPILHRKELMLPQEHPRRAEFEALTK